MIAFEGVDGAGKSTVLQIVAERLREAGVSVSLPRVGKEHKSRPIRGIRRLTRGRVNLELRARAELLLYAAREAQVLDQHVRPALVRGDTVLLDRSMLTPVVLGAFGRGLDLRACERVTETAAAGLKPDLTVVFDVEPRTSRIRKRIDKIRKAKWRNAGRKGLAGSGLKHRIRAGYQSLAGRDDLPLIHTERSSPAQVAERVLSLLERGCFDEPEEDRHPWWLVDPRASFEEAVETLPPFLGLYFTRRLPVGRGLRSAWLEREPELVIWAADLDDPLLERASEIWPERVLERISALPRAAHLRLELMASHPEVVARSLVRVAGAEADRMREVLARRAPGAVLESLLGRSDAFALELRARLWKHGDSYERALSLQHCDDPDAWRRRARLLEKDPAVTIPTLVGLPPERVDSILIYFAALAPKSVLKALRGRSDPTAHTLRVDLLDTGREVVDSIAGLDDPASWALRERCLERWPSTVATSLRGLSNFSSDPRVSRLLQRCSSAAPDDLFLKRRRFQLEHAPESD